MNCLIAGASGLVGHALLDRLLAEPRVSTITALARSDLKPQSGKIKIILSSFDELEKLQLPGCDVAFCCLGTTIKKAGSKAAFSKVDHDYVINFAKAASRAGARKFVAVSALGADAKSQIFYNQVKGQTEEDLRKIGFENLILMRPSLLIGPRSESRPGERVAQVLAPFYTPLLIGPLAKSKPIAADKVAARMLTVAFAESGPRTPVQIILNHEI